MTGNAHPDSQPPEDPWVFAELDEDSALTWGDSSDPAPAAELPRFRRSLSMQRTRFTGHLADESIATVDVDHASGRTSLYLNNRHERTADMPTQFTLGSERIEVAASRYGMRRIHLIRADGSHERLDPAAGTPERWRERLSQRHPKISRAIAVGAVSVLVVNLILLAPQVLELLTHLTIWPDRFPSFVSPVDLPGWVNTILTMTAALAATERALTFRHHRILDVETDGLDA